MDRSVPEIPGTRCLPVVETYLKQLVSSLLRTKPHSFPGSQPVSFTREHLHNNLVNRDYLVCEKSDGLRVLLLVVINADNGEEGTFLITRENEYFHVPDFHFPRSKDNMASSHNGTIIDGELVYSTNPQTKAKEVRFLIFDCLAMDGKSITDKLLYKRLYHAQMDFHVPYIELRRKFPDACKSWAFKLDFKHMTQSFKISKVFSEMKNLTHVSDGLILTCCDSPYISGTDTTLLKWKPAEENTIDFKIELEFPLFTDTELPKHDPNREYIDYDAKPNFKLYVWKGGEDLFRKETIEENIKRNGGNYVNSFDNYDYWNDLVVSNEQWEQLKATGESFNGRIGECRQNPDGTWELLRFRDDKLNGNHINVVVKILKSIEDAVTKEELMEMEEEIKARWMERENAANRSRSVQEHFAGQKRRVEQGQMTRTKIAPPAAGVSAAAPAPAAPVAAPVADDDEYYESDGFEEMPTYQETS